MNALAGFSEEKLAVRLLFEGLVIEKQTKCAADAEDLHSL